MEFELSDQAAAVIALALEEGSSAAPLEEHATTRTIGGTVKLRGFTTEFIDQVPPTFKFRVEATNLGGRVRITIDVQK